MIFCSSLVSHVRPKMHSLATWQNVMIQKCEIPNEPSLHLDAWLIVCTVLKSHDLAKMQRPQDDVIFCLFQLYDSFNFAYFLPPANEVCEGCVFISVYLSTGRGCLPQCKCMLGHTPLPQDQRQTPPPRSRHLPRTRARHPPGGDNPRTRGRPPEQTPPQDQRQTPPRRRHPPYQRQTPPRADTGNKRAVRILLKCILVENLKTRRVGLKSLLERHHVTSEEFVIHIMQEEFLELYETS